MATESPLERAITSVADYVIDIMKYSLEDSDSETQSPPTTEVAQALSPSTPYDSDDEIPNLVEDAINAFEVTFLDAHHRSVADGTSKSSLDQIKQLFSDRGEDAATVLDAHHRGCATPAEDASKQLFSNIPLPPKLVVRGNMTVEGDVVCARREQQLASIQASVNTITAKLGELGQTLERIEALSASEDRISDLASGISNACNAFASALAPAPAPTPPSALPDLEKGLSRMEDTLLRELSAVQDSVCHMQHELEYDADRSRDKILTRVSDVETMLDTRTRDINADLVDIPRQIKSELDSVCTYLYTQIGDESRHLSEETIARTNDLHHDLDVILKRLETKLEDESAKLKEDVGTYTNDLHSDIDIVHKRLEVDVQQIPERVHELVRGNMHEELTNLKVAVQTCVGGLRQESRLDRAERSALAREVGAIRDSLGELDPMKAVDELQVGFNRFHYDWDAHTRNVESNFETHSKILRELQGRQEDLEAQICAMRGDARRDRKQLNELHSMMATVLRRLPEPQKKPNEPDWTSL